MSKKSRELVEKTIAEEKPDVVGVELDKKRYASLKDGAKFQELNIVELVRTGQTWVLLINIILKNFQRQIGAQLNEKPGSEMIAAINAAENSKIPVALVDRDVGITLRRAFHFLTFIEKLKFVYAIISGLFTKEKEKINEKTIEKMKEKDVLNSLMQQMGKEFPTIKRILVDERDEYIAHKLSNLKGKKILAVLGAGHLDGVEKKIGKRIDVQEITSIPKKISMLKIAGYLVPIIVIGLIVYGVYTKGIDVGIESVMLWIIVNSTLAALGVVIARGHPFAVASAFIAAPFTSLHPMIAVGWVAGFVQAKMSLPQVKDFEQLDSLNSYNDLEKNKVTRILLVAAFANLGATIGTVVALPWIGSLIL